MYTKELKKCSNYFQNDFVIRTKNVIKKKFFLYSNDLKIGQYDRRDTTGTGVIRAKICNNSENNRVSVVVFP